MPDKSNDITRLLSGEEVVSSYGEVARLYPHIPSLSLWRAWEHAAYKGYSLLEPVLDIGCGDGRWFRLVWPEVREVYGVDIDPATVSLARQSGVYREVFEANASAMTVGDNTYASVFANCSLEHMEHLNAVVSGIHRCLRPGGVFLFSVVTDKYLEWATLPLLMEWMGDRDTADRIRSEFPSYHHLVNALPVEGWCDVLTQAGFEVLEHTPIMPEITSRFFLFLDSLWHLRSDKGELGEPLQSYLQTLPNFPTAFGKILEQVRQMEVDLLTGSGAVFLARKI